MVLVRTYTLALMLAALAPACAPNEIIDPAVPALAAQVSGTWSLTTVTTVDPMPARAVVAARLTLADDRSWRFRYDYHITGEPYEVLHSAGLSGSWTAQPGAPPALHFDVLDDHSSAVALLRNPGTLEVTLAGVAMRLQRTPD